MDYANWLAHDLDQALAPLSTVRLFKINLGPRYRVTKDKMSGSLWLEPQQDAFRLKLTGEVKSSLEASTRRLAGLPALQDQSNPVWKISDPRVMVDLLNALERC